MATDTRIWPDIAIPPGELLAETLESLGLSQAELARRTSRPAQAINEIVRGSKEITPETALQLERVVGVPAHVWTRLEADYRFNRARLEDQARLRHDLPRVRRYPHADMAKLGWVRRTRDALERLQELLRFFGVASLRQVPATQAAAFRKSRTIRTSPEALTARPPEAFEPRLRQLLAECGIVLALVPHLPKTGAHGATRWLTTDRALLQLSIRHRWDDIFWFSLFHELGHLRLHGRDLVFVEGRDDHPDAPEREADRFASEHLVPSAAYKRFVARPDHRQAAAIQGFSREIGVAPSIVVGRLQHDGHLHHWELNELRSRFVWTESSRR